MQLKHPDLRDVQKLRHAASMEDPRFAGAVELFGEPAICYLANLAPAELAAARFGDVALDTARGTVLAEVLATAGMTAAHPYPLSQLPGLCVAPGGGEAQVQAWLRRSGRTVTPTPTDDPLLAELRRLAVDLFPLLLIPMGDLAAFPRIATAALEHPRRGALANAVRGDAAIARLLSAPTDPDMRVLAFRSTRAGNSVEVETLGGMLIGAAWDRLRPSGVPDLAAVEAAIDEVVASVRAAAMGKPAACPVLLAFAGLHLPAEIVDMPLPFGRLRRVTDHDRWLYQASRAGWVEHTDETGATTRFDYDGDVVLETSLPYRMQVVGLDDVKAWPADLSDVDLLIDRIDTVALAAALTFQRPELTVIGPTWSAVFDPLSVMPLSGQRDGRSYAGLTMVAATADEVHELARWIARIDSVRTHGIAVGIRRTNSALRERHEAADSLVDAVIAWENLFGTGQGEITFRVSMALARLLAESETDRQALFGEISKLYRMRSAVVHGEHVDPARCAVSARRAREITVEMWRVLFRDEPALLTVQQRARALLLR